jgi:hypothetical protein
VGGRGKGEKKREKSVCGERERREKRKGKKK